MSDWTNIFLKIRKKYLKMPDWTNNHSKIMKIYIQFIFFGETPNFTVDLCQF